SWPVALRKRLLEVMAPAATTTQEICDLNSRISGEFARTVELLLKRTGVDRGMVEAIGSHGQTVCHLPANPSRDRKGATFERLQRASGSLPYGRGSDGGSTLQLGDPSVLATLTGIQTVGNFRPADMALGGQGAPLVPWTDAVLLRHKSRTRCIQNIGGIANVTYLPRGSLPHGRGSEGVLAFDTGPGNMLLDALVALGTEGKLRYDRNAHLARRGHLNTRLLAALQAHPYFARRPPKSTGREEFGLPLARKFFTRYRRDSTSGGMPGVARKVSSPPFLSDLLHTATYLTAWSIVDAYQRFLPTLPDEVILCGGGADNPLLVEMLDVLLADAAPAHTPELRRIDELGIPNKAKEAASFALLAAATLDGIPANVPAVTGARRPTLLGVIAPRVSPIR
ncbi:MAG: anhydro-N-acetylmuramic acid kinase, partial [Phycisphaerae bacterium]